MAITVERRASYRLAQVNNTQNGLQANYTYNFMGQRVRKVMSGSQSSDSRYFYSPQGKVNLMKEYRKR